MVTLEEKRKELQAISSIFDDASTKMHPAILWFGQNCKFRRQKFLPC